MDLIVDLIYCIFHDYGDTGKIYLRVYYHYRIFYVALSFSIEHDKLCTR